MLTRASYIVTGTRIGKEEIQNFYGVSPDRIRLLPHPTPPFALVESAKEVKISVSKPYVFYPAQFWAHKNHVVLLQMMAELKKRGHSLQCVFVGSDKGNKSHIAELARKWQVKDQVKFLGFVSRDELVALYKSALATVYPSLCGPENLPPLEAMALGSPVIATSIKGALEQLNDAAILVSGQDPSAWADAVEKLLHDEELRKEMIKRGRTRAQRYTQKEFSDDLFKIFDEFRIVFFYGIEHTFSFFD
jgi:glycosyltransferase involved in cell wall biosynthesis